MLSAHKGWNVYTHVPELSNCMWTVVSDDVNVILFLHAYIFSWRGLKRQSASWNWKHYFDSTEISILVNINYFWFLSPPSGGDIVFSFLWLYIKHSQRKLKTLLRQINFNFRSWQISLPLRQQVLSKLDLQNRERERERDWFSLSN